MRSIAVFCLFSFILHGSIARCANPSSKPLPLASLLERSMGIVQRQYWKGPVDEKVLMEGALAGMTEKLNELEKRKGEAKPPEWNAFLPPQRHRLLNQELAGRFAGIGARIKLDEASGLVLLEEVLEGSPSLAAGLHNGDLIESIDGHTVKGSSLRSIVSKLRGKKGSRIWLRIRRSGALLDFRFRRGAVKVPTAEARMLTPEGAAYLRIRNFHRGTAAAVSVKIRSLLAKNAKFLVLDLRGNPGGSLAAAVATASLFLDKGTLVVTTEGRNNGKKELRARGSRVWNHPICCIVDETTASGAEILAGSLRGASTAILAGQRSFGKVSAQGLFSLPGNYALKISTSGFTLPCASDEGRLVPDVALAVEKNEKKEPVKLRKMKDIHEDPWVRSALAILTLKR